MQKSNADFTTTRGIILLRPIGHISDNEIFSPIINLSHPAFARLGRKDEIVAVEGTPHPTPTCRAPDNGAVQGFFSSIVLKSLVFDFS